MNLSVIYLIEIFDCERLAQPLVVLVTVQIWSNETVIWSVYKVKWILFKWIFCLLKMLAHQCQLLCSIPLVRAFKWGAVWHSTSRGIRTASILIQKFPKCLLLLSKVESPNLQVVAVLMPLEIKRHTVPHLKALTRSIDHWGRHGHSSTFKLHYTVLKSTILLHKSAKRRFHVTVAVSCLQLATTIAEKSFNFLMSSSCFTC